MLADGHGACIHLGERDCSLQRRHQKIVEESPSPAVDATSAPRSARPPSRSPPRPATCGAGTVEFLVGGDGDVVLPRAERAAAGRAPGDRGGGRDRPGAGAARDRRRRAARARAGRRRRCAATRSSAASTPRIRRRASSPRPAGWPRLRLPAWPGVRVDAGVREGDEVGVRYDPLLAKLIAHAEDRDACIERMAAALAETSVLGVTRRTSGSCAGCSTSPASAPATPGIDFVERRVARRARAAAARRRPPRRRSPPGTTTSGTRSAAAPAAVEAADGFVLYAAGSTGSRPTTARAALGRGGGRLAAGADAGHGAAGRRARGPGRRRGRAARRARGDEDGARGVGARPRGRSRQCSWRRATWSHAGQALVELDAP